MFNIEFDITPTLEQLKGFINSVEKEVLNDLKPFWDGYAQPLVAEEVARCFVTQGYGTWAPLSAKYAYYKNRAYPGRTILRRKDVLFTAATRKAALGNLYETKPDEMVWGVDLGFFVQAFKFPYPVMHEQGYGKMPQRAIFQLVDQQKTLHDNLVNALSLYMSKKIEEEAKKLPRG